MATVYSDVRTSTTQNDPSEFVKTNQMGGNVRVAYAQYEASGTSAGDVIEMFALPHGARVISGNLHWDALGASTNLTVGHAEYVDADGTTVTADPDEFKGSTTTTSAGQAAVAASTGLGALSEVSLKSQANNEFVVTVTVGGGAATGTIDLQMLYVVD